MTPHFQAEHVSGPNVKMGLSATGGEGVVAPLFLIFFAEVFQNTLFRHSN